MDTFFLMRLENKNKKPEKGPWYVLEFVQLDSAKYWIFFLHVAGHDFAVGSFQITVLLRIFFLVLTFQKMFISML